jgi:radical SAM-linked protein
LSERIRFRFTKLGKVRWTSHRDVARMWERAARRVGLPVAYTSGFSPRPRISFGLALPTGHESQAEYLDVEVADGAALDVTSDLAALTGRLSAALPGGIDVVAAAPIPPRTPSLQEAVTSCSWQWTAVSVGGLSGEVLAAELAQRVDALLSAPSLTVTRTRKGREVTDDIRDTVLELRVLGPVPVGIDAPDARSGVRLEAELATQPRSLRPSELLAGLGADLEERDPQRTHQWISLDGARREPIPLRGEAAVAPCALERAS